MNIDELTLGQIRELQSMLGGCNVKQHNPYPTSGENVFIRTVTNYYIGKLIEVGPQEIVLTNASWIPDTGRFNVAIMTGELDEVEPYPSEFRVIVGRGAIIDSCPWIHQLPTGVK